VFPVAVVDELLKTSGLPTASEMHSAPLARLRELTGADAVLYPVLRAYGSKYHIVSTDTVVRVTARLVDTRTGATLWQGAGEGRSGSGGTNNGFLGALIEAATTKAMTSSTDAAHDVSRMANQRLFRSLKAP